MKIGIESPAVSMKGVLEPDPQILSRVVLMTCLDTVHPATLGIREVALALQQ